MENMNDWLISEDGTVTKLDTRSNIEPYVSSVVLKRANKDYLVSENCCLAVGGVGEVDFVAQTAEVQFELNDLVVVRFEEE